MDVYNLRFLKLLRVRNERAILQAESIADELLLPLLARQLPDHGSYSIVQKSSAIIGVRERLYIK